MGRAGARKPDGEPERRCIATGEVQPKAGLIRFVVGPDDQIVPDLAAKLPGRGIWVAADRDALELAVRKRLFARAAKRQVTLPEGLVDLVEAGLLRRVVEGLSLARKAGQAVVGYEKVKGWLDSGRAAVLVQASDGSERGKTKLRPPQREGAYIDCLTAGEIGLAFGREHVIHGALAAGGLMERVVEDAAKLSGIRKKIGGEAPGKG
ncbi:RNA-binding protein [Rhodovulum sp.]|uniref:RNA-binding protein n=1 Tax=Rhodovulum sp. TaxID=34009 RepID=UPI001794719B|nr:RNA-binding protein [Rhodovulum sp.]HDR28406.1 RNA-binding protein [Rhodovulum sp.]